MSRDGHIVEAESVWDASGKKLWKCTVKIRVKIESGISYYEVHTVHGLSTREEAFEMGKDYIKSSSYNYEKQEKERRKRQDEYRRNRS